MHQYIFLASLSLGGAEKIVVEHLLLNRFAKTTLIILHNKENEYALPKGVNLLRLNGKISKGEALFQQMAFENKMLVAHLISDRALDYLFSFNLKLSLVFHNDQEGWKNSETYFNHPNISLLITVSKHIKKQLEPLTHKPIVVIQHRLSLAQPPQRDIRQALRIPKSQKIIGMVGRIAPQKDYLYAIELLHATPHALIIVGGYERVNESYYQKLIKKIVECKMQERVFLVGFRANVADYIALFDMGFNSSSYEGLSVATQEMLSYNIPVYVADNLGQQEILDLDENLHFFSKKETTAFTFSFESNKNSNMALKRSLFKQSLAQWNLLPSIDNTTQPKETLFLTQNLGLGGAQRSLVNLLVELKRPLVVLNRSNHTSFIAELYRNKNEVHYLDRRDVYDICIELFREVSSYQKVIFWNLDPKVKLLLTKFFPQKSFIDVSPGNYMFEELLVEKEFTLAINYEAEAYFNALEKMVSKYDFSNEIFPHKSLILPKTVTIPNGVLKPKKIKQTYNFQGKALLLGRIASSKFVAEIVQAFCANEELSLTLIGSVHEKEKAYYRASVVPYIQNNILQKEAVDNAQEVMLEYDFIIVLGVNQGSPNTILESLSVGLPVIANNSGGTKAMLGNSGILLEEISPETIALALQEMVENYEDYVVKSKCRQQEVVEEYSMQKFVSSYQDLCRID